MITISASPPDDVWPHLAEPVRWPEGPPKQQRIASRCRRQCCSSPPVLPGCLFGTGDTVIIAHIGTRTWCEPVGRSSHAHGFWLPLPARVAIGIDKLFLPKPLVPGDKPDPCPLSLSGSCQRVSSPHCPRTAGCCPAAAAHPLPVPSPTPIIPPLPLAGTPPRSY